MQFKDWSRESPSERDVEPRDGRSTGEYDRNRAIDLSIQSISIPWSLLYNAYRPSQGYETKALFELTTSFSASDKDSFVLFTYGSMV